LGPLIPISAGAALNNPALRALVSRKTSADVQGGALGLSASFDSLARFLGPATAGVLYKSAGIASPYWTAGVVMAAAFLFALSQKSRMAAPPEIVSSDIPSAAGTQIDSHTQPLESPR